ncbi:terpene synthase family protein [Streptomyces sp. NPDC059355]|uniref:terpene synthase family protein n=1 Tax=Streptomyces sp. NPDC059355 TaxID=3346811 RepID=UPI00369F2985
MALRAKLTFFDGDMAPETPIAIGFDSAPVVLADEKAHLSYNAVCGTRAGEYPDPDLSGVEAVTAACLDVVRSIAPEQLSFAKPVAQTSAVWTAHAFPDQRLDTPPMIASTMLNTALFLHDDGVDDEQWAHDPSAAERIRELEELNGAILRAFRSDCSSECGTSDLDQPRQRVILGLLREVIALYAAHLPRWHARKGAFTSFLKEYFDACEWYARELAASSAWPVDHTTFLFQREFLGAGNMMFELAALLNDVDISPPRQDLLEVKRFRQAATYAAVWGNDVMGLERDIVSGGLCNIALILRREGGLTLQEACTEAMERQNREGLEVMRLAEYLDDRYPDLRGYTRVVRLVLEGNFRGFPLTPRYRLQNVPHIRGIRTVGMS